MAFIRAQGIYFEKGGGNTRPPQKTGKRAKKNYSCPIFIVRIFKSFLVVTLCASVLASQMTQLIPVDRVASGQLVGTAGRSQNRHELHAAA